MHQNKKLPDWLRVAVQLATLGEITTNMRLIAGHISENNTFTLIYYFEKSPGEEDMEAVGDIGANIDASLGTTTFKGMRDKCVCSTDQFGKLETYDGVFYARREM